MTRRSRMCAQQLDALEREATDEVRAEGVPREQITATRSLDLRYRGRR